ncbi:MAG: tetratricopeptide repeat protein [Victivallaceae bacterium]|jgi:TPR repeat protein
MTEAISIIKHNDEKKYLKAKACFEREFKKGNYDAAFRLGCIYDEGLGVKKDYKKAFYYYSIAADKNYPDAINNLGLIYEHGNGVPQDFIKAKQLYEKAIGAGSKNAEANLGKMYYLEKDYLKAKEYFEKAISHGRIKANVLLGMMYFNGNGVKKDYKKAFSLLEGASENPLAKYMLAYMYETGSGVTQDYKKSFELYKGAEDSLPCAMFKVGYFYYNGICIPKNIDKGLEYILKAGNNGDSDAQIFLGKYYSEEKKDDITSEQWYQKVIAKNKPIMLNSLAWAWAMQGKKLEKAEELIKQALQEEPQNSSYIDTFGYIFYKQGKYKEALEQFLKADKLKTDSIIKDHLGDTYLKLGMKNEAQKAWQDALSLTKYEENQQNDIKVKIENMNKSDGK